MFSTLRSSQLTSSQNNRARSDFAELLPLLVEGSSAMQTIAPRVWENGIPALRRLALLGRVAESLRDANGGYTLPAKLRDHMRAASVVAAHHQRTLVWEADRVASALRGLDAPVVLLKGGAYAIAGLPPARGRLASDIDIMVPRDYLPATEAALLSAGWEATKLDAYDQRYYRTWMHELPPLRHALRGTFVDVHHSILPLTARLKPDASLLFEAALPVTGTRFRVLSPIDMVLHCATHLFYDGELSNGLRDLLDFHDLLTHFAGAPGFWDDLLPRAQQLDLQLPLFYALRYSARFLATPIPEPVVSEATRYGPSRVLMTLMDVVVKLTMLPGPRSAAGSLAQMMLYVRSHYLRMPLYLLVPHLLRKSWLRISQSDSGGE